MPSLGLTIAVVRRRSVLEVVVAPVTFKTSQSEKEIKTKQQQN
jgi:hypothetical protein